MYFLWAHKVSFYAHMGKLYTLCDIFFSDIFGWNCFVYWMSWIVFIVKLQCLCIGNELHSKNKEFSVCVLFGQIKTKVVIIIYCQSSSGYIRILLQGTSETWYNITNYIKNVLSNDYHSHHSNLNIICLQFIISTCKQLQICVEWMNEIVWSFPIKSFKTLIYSKRGIIMSERCDNASYRYWQSLFENNTASQKQETVTGLQLFYFGIIIANIYIYIYILEWIR